MSVRVASLLLAASAVLSSACQAVPVAELHGSGAGPSNVVALAAGTYRIDWSGWDDDPPRDGCLLGLTIELTTAKRLGGRGFVVPTVPSKLTYRPVAAGASVTGRTDGAPLVEGLYRLLAEGSCAWQVRFTPLPSIPPR